MVGGKCGENVTWLLSGDTLIISGRGDMENYSYDLAQNRITTPWYDYCKLIKKIIINDGVTSIGNDAFWECTLLKSLMIADSVTTIGRGALYFCENLTDLKLSNNLISVDADSFYNCSSLKEIILPDSVEIIGAGAFSNCYNAKCLKLSQNLTCINIESFRECYSLTHITIPNGVISIDNQGFNRCSGLISIELSDNVVSIGEGAFGFCGKLKGIQIPDSVTTIGEAVFYNCRSLKEIHYPAGRGFEKNLSQGNNAKLIPYNVTLPVTQPIIQSGNEPKFYPAQPTKPQPKFYPVQSIKPVVEKLTWSFAGKTLTVGGVRVIENFPYSQIPWRDHLRDIQRIIIGNGVEKISARAFSECPRLELLELPASVKTIGDMAFSVCFCGSINGVKNVFWCLEDGVLVLKKNPDAPPAADFSTDSVSWIFAEKNIRGVKLGDGVKPTAKFFEWMTRQFNGKEISFK
ncbi:MAG: leucine-rich repeat protein [Selenomonadaceae bacterium]|nr:leucine-rich repeat protein [Selenomonadaceae bacterium]